ncbi:Flp pilus assembly complex ATPase component TadA [bacterium]|jgi:twitching motility protein PilT|nr:Flp pilus assembly complex ATPase component TadA [bacterium]MBT4649322.1 Flp pilus assembly complex ATPase component TadA [bacterium]
MSTTETLLINKILNIAAERKASDVHLTAGNYPVLRVDGKLVTLTGEQVLTPDFLLGMAESFLIEVEKKELEQEREVVTVYIWANRARFRSKVFYQKGYVAISLRLIPQLIRSPKDLGLPSALTQMVTKEKGLIIITGPFGSGRTTTVASLLETLNRNKGLHIQTLEQPIEYLLANNQSIIEQREIGKDTATFIKGLQDTIDEDVDVVTASSLEEDGMEELLLQVAESGKLVIVVMDADTVITALERFISNIDPDRKIWGRDILSQVLLGVVAQRLLPRIGSGLSLAYEVLTMTSAVQAIIKDNRLYQLKSIMQTSREEGMVNLDKSLLELVRVGEISVDDALQYAGDPQMFKRNF